VKAPGPFVELGYPGEQLRESGVVHPPWVDIDLSHGGRCVSECPRDVRHRHADGVTV